jgi:hypothetical protein
MNHISVNKMHVMYGMLLTLGFWCQLSLQHQDIAVFEAPEREAVEKGRSKQDLCLG